MKKSKWHNRGFISFLTVSGFLIMGITGIILYIVPQGRIAYWVDWQFLGLTKDQWGNIHILSSLLFIIVGIFHIYFNWKPLINYIISKTKKGINLKKELIVATVLSLLVVVSAISNLPPLKYLLDLNASIKDAWIVNREYEPPFGHAELLSFKVFTKKMNIDSDRALRILTDKNIVITDTGQSLAEIARSNKTSPMNIYLLIKHLEKTPELETKAKQIYTPELVEEKFAGTGIGNKTVDQFCSELSLDCELVIKRLEKKDIAVTADMTLKKIAEKYETTPIDILKTMLIAE